jgi:hypothetical protein
VSRTQKMLWIIPLATISISCARNTTETVRTISNYCLIAKGISYSEKKVAQTETAENKYDTPETVKQVKEHDLAYERTCSSAQPATPEQ